MKKLILIITIIPVLLSCSKSEKEEVNVPEVIIKPVFQPSEKKHDLAEVITNYAIMLSNLTPRSETTETLPEPVYVMPDKTVQPEKNEPDVLVKDTNTFVQPETPTNEVVIPTVTEPEVDSENWFDIRIHPDDSEYVMAIYNSELTAERNEVWASALMMGFDSAYQSAAETDTLAVGLVYIDGTMEVYTVSYADYFGYVGDEITLKTFLGKIRVMK